MERRERRTPAALAEHFVLLQKDQPGFTVKYIDDFTGD